MPRDLTPYPLNAALAAMRGAEGGVVIVTMGAGQWDSLLAAAYARDCILVELDEAEVPVRAYRRTVIAKTTRALARARVVDE